jgi:hypothetical protein
MRPFHSYRSWLRTDRMRVEIQVSTALVRGREGAAPLETASLPTTPIA